MASMDGLKKSGADTKGNLQKGIEEITRMGDDFQGVKDQLQGMPEGLDADIVAAIKEAEDTGRAEASADIEAARSSIIDQAKSSADTIRSDVQSKISENKTAQGKLDGISSKYGKGAIDRAKSAIADNTRMGEDLISDLENAVKAADQGVKDVKDRL